MTASTGHGPAHPQPSRSCPLKALLSLVAVPCSSPSHAEWSGRRSGKHLKQSAKTCPGPAMGNKASNETLQLATKGSLSKGIQMVIAVSMSSHLQLLSCRRYFDTKGGKAERVADRRRV